MTLRLNGSTSGYTEIDAPAVAGSNTLTLPTGNGTTDQVLSGNGSGALSWVDRGRMVLETAKTTTSGTSIDFTGIPSWVKKITVMFNNVSLSGTDSLLVQVGAGSITTTGYTGSGSYGTNNTGLASTSGFVFTVGTAAAGLYGHMLITNLSSNTWLNSHQGFLAGTTVSEIGGGSIALSGTLDRLRITPTGSNTFDAGSVNILYEG